MYKYLIVVLVLGLFLSSCVASAQEDYMLTEPQATDGVPAATEAVEVVPPAGEARPVDDETEQENVTVQPVYEPLTAGLDLIPSEARSVGELIAIPAPDMPDAVAKLVNNVLIDLSGRLKIDLSEIELVEIKEVVWRDSSLGCPLPGMNYLMVVTEGYQIVLKAQGRQHFYHTSGTSHFVLCVDGKPRAPDNTDE